MKPIFQLDGNPKGEYTAAVSLPCYNPKGEYNPALSPAWHAPKPTTHFNQSAKFDKTVKVNTTLPSFFLDTRGSRRRAAINLPSKLKF